MNRLGSLVQRLQQALEVPGLLLPTAGVRVFGAEETVAEELFRFEPDGVAVTSCHALRAAMLDDAVFLSARSVGCVAAAVSLGFEDMNREDPLEGPREYTEIMRRNSGDPESFRPPSPREFSDGTVYAFREAGKKEYALFGEEDSGRYASRAVALRALSGMLAIQPPATRGVFYFSPGFDDLELDPDVVVLSVRPVELCRLIQGYQYLTGERVEASVGGLRAGCSDLVVRPYLTGTINFSPFCLGARLIARFEGDRMGLGIPGPLFETLVRGVEASRTGFPFPQYPGAVH